MHASRKPTFPDGVSPTVTPAERKPRALVVDDSPDITSLFALILEQEGYDVETRLSAYSALEIAADEQFDFVISDIGMPGMCGYELATRLRAMPMYKTVPMIAVTGYAEYADRNLAHESGFDAYLTKPVDPTTFIELVVRLGNAAQQ